MTQTEEAHIQDPEEARDDAHGAPSVDDHHDPLHDIDGFKTVLAVFGSLFAIVFLIWAMTHLFNQLAQVERRAKIGDTPPTELLKLRSGQQLELQGGNPARGTKTIEQSMREIATR